LAYTATCGWFEVFEKRDLSFCAFVSTQDGLDVDYDDDDDGMLLVEVRFSRRIVKKLCNSIQSVLFRKLESSYPILAWH
jgi:hypothetical protein